jgi:hypothetical protein
MVHFVEPFFAGDGDEKSILSYREELQEAHLYLSESGALALRSAAELAAEGGWGANAKRVKVHLPETGRPVLIGEGIREHSLVEVINQCANMERLLDTLQWAENEPGLEGCVVERCHPTTSSVSDDEGDNDLVLVKSGAPEARFEISDVASKKDGNNKEKKDLARLGVLQKGTFEPRNGWHGTRLFLVVSQEFGERLTNSRRRLTHCNYERLYSVGDTIILEVKKRVSV